MESLPPHPQWDTTNAQPNIWRETRCIKPFPNCGLQKTKTKSGLHACPTKKDNIRTPSVSHQRQPRGNDETTHNQTNNPHKSKEAVDTDTQSLGRPPISHDFSLGCSTSGYQCCKKKKQHLVWAKMVRCGDSQRLLPHMPPNKGGCPRCARANHVVSEKLNTRTTTRADCPPRTRADTPRCHDASRRRAGTARCNTPSFLEDKTPDFQTGWAHLNAATQRRVGTAPRQTFDILRLLIFVYFVSVHHEHVDAITFLLVGTVSTSRQFDTDCGTVGRLEASNRETLRGSRVVLCGITRRDQLCFTHAHIA